MADGSQDTTSFIPLDQISIKPGFNPRRYIGEAALQELVASVREAGVVTPIVIRPRDDAPGYWITTGERRYRAAIEIGLASIPAMVRAVSEAEALVMAIAENRNREPLTPSEEAHLARRMVGEVDGDREEAARRLGWSKSVLESRLLLVNAIDEALEAQMNGHIKLGHVELLASLPPSQQPEILKKLVTHSVTVAAFQAQMAKHAQTLTTARFDTAECRGCRFNTALQSQLFEAHVGPDRCTNRTCWNEKSSSHVATIHAATAKEYPAVFMDLDKDPATYKPVSATGPEGVGEKQMREGCQGCANFGAVISSVAGTEGEVKSSICFNLGCRTKMVSANQAAVAGAKKAKTAATKAANRASPKAKPLPKPGKTKFKTVKAGASPAAAPTRVPQRVREQNWEAIRSVASRAVANSPRLRLLVVGIAMELMTERGKQPHAILQSLRPLNDDALRTKIAELAIKAVLKTVTAHNYSDKAGDPWLSVGAKLIEEGGVSMADGFTMTPAYLALHTKGAMLQLAEDAGLTSLLPGENDDQRRAAFAALEGKRNDEILKTITAAAKSFPGYVPPSLSAEVADQVKRR